MKEAVHSERYSAMSSIRAPDAPDAFILVPKAPTLSSSRRRALDQQRAGQNQTVTALMNRGLSEDMARAAAGNPTMLRAVLWQLYQPQARSPSSQGRPT